MYFIQANESLAFLNVTIYWVCKLKKATQLNSQFNNIRSIDEEQKENNFLVQHVIKFHADVKEKLDRILNVEKLAGGGRWRESNAMG
jgi:predicted nuclease with TOPRIM domain